MCSSTSARCQVRSAESLGESRITQILLLGWGSDSRTAPSLNFLLTWLPIFGHIFTQLSLPAFSAIQRSTLMTSPVPPASLEFSLVLLYSTQHQHTTICTYHIQLVFLLKFIRISTHDYRLVRKGDTHYYVYSPQKG